MGDIEGTIKDIVNEIIDEKVVELKEEFESDIEDLRSKFDSDIDDVMVEIKKFREVTRDTWRSYKKDDDYGGSGNKWSGDEEDDLMSELDTFLEYISILHKRTPLAIRKRIEKVWS